MAPSQVQPALVDRIPAEFSGSSGGAIYSPQAWWTAFEDPVLDVLVQRALERNLDVAEAAGRLGQASAQARLSRSDRFPSITAQGSESSTSTPVDGLAFGGIAGGAIDRIENEAYTLDLGASYELDLWGRARNDFRASRSDAIATAADLRTVQLSAAAETISAYFEIVDLTQQIELTKKTAEVLNDRAERTEERFQRGLVDSFELYSVQQDLRGVEASLPELESALASTKARLGVLLAAYPGEVDAMIDAPLTPRLVFNDVPAGLPASLLDQRPDIAAGWARMEAARYRIGARRAERFPQISLSASIGSQGGDGGSLFDFANNWASSLAASVVAPIFDAGRINANIQSARAVYDQQAAAYARTVITAFGEVESAVTDYEEQRRRYLLITRQLAEARSSLDLQRRRYAAGVGGYLPYLDALRTAYQVETNLSSAARATALARLGVHRALGGDWTAGNEFSALEMVPSQLAEGEEP